MNEFLHIEKTYTVLELNTAVRDLLKTAFPHHIWVCGEIQGFRPDRNKKHIYFELVQKNPDGDDIIAKTKMALFANRKATIFSRLQHAKASFSLQNDIEVKFLCEVSLHPPTGQYSLIIVDIDPIYTLGKMAQARQRIIDELKKEGLIERNKLLKLSSLPLTLGLISAQDSAAYHDFNNELKVSGYAFTVFSYNAHMQGKNVEHDVVNALRYFNHLKNPPDVIVITRGGGSKADLAWFDNKRIATAVATSGIPILSALGHQIDVSIIDLIAHTTLKTPTKAAQFLVQTITDFIDSAENAYQSLIDEAVRYLDNEKTDLKTKTLTLDAYTTRFLRDYREHLTEISSLVASSAKHACAIHSRGLAEIILSLNKETKRTLNETRNQIQYIESRITLLNPRTILKRGYSMTTKDGIIIKSASQLQEGDLVKNIYSQGESISQIQKLGG